MSSSKAHRAKAPAVVESPRTHTHTHTLPVPASRQAPTWQSDRCCDGGDRGRLIQAPPRPDYETFCTVQGEELRAHSRDTYILRSFRCLEKFERRLVQSSRTQNFQVAILPSRKHVGWLPPHDIDHYTPFINETVWKLRTTTLLHEQINSHDSALRRGSSLWSQGERLEP